MFLGPCGEQHVWDPYLHRWPVPGHAGQQHRRHGNLHLPAALPQQRAQHDAVRLEGLTELHQYGVHTASPVSRCKFLAHLSTKCSVSFCDPSMSGVRRQSNLTKLYRNDPWVVRYQSCPNRSSLVSAFIFYI